MELRRLRITGGLVIGGATNDGGGGIRNDAPLRVIDSEIAANSVQGDGITLGGGIYTRGPLGILTITGSTIAGNQGRAVGNSNP